MIGKQIGKYELREKRGEGGFGVLYKAFDTGIEREIAFKLLHQQLASEKKFSAWFHREAKAMAKLNHPNIVTIFDFEVVDDYHFIIMEYIDGKNVDEVLLEKGPFSIPDAISIGRQLLSALGYAHANGIIHRDIKPSNIMLTSSGLVKITDFGIAKILGASKLTQTGTAAGSLPYMSPEQIRGKQIDHRTDLYSLGITLYQMITGDVPFQEDSDFLLMQAHLEKPPPKPSIKRAELPSGLEDILLKSLEKKVDDRYTSASDMSLAFINFQQKEGVQDNDSVLTSQAFESKADKTVVATSESEGRTIFQPPLRKKGVRPILLIFSIVALVVVVYVVMQMGPGGVEPPGPGPLPIDSLTVDTSDTSDGGQPDPDTSGNNGDITPPKPAHAGKLEIYYTPYDYGSGADVFIDGIKITHSDIPMYLDTLKPGRHTIKLVRQSHEWVNNCFFDTITINENKQTRDYNFLATSGKVRLSSNFIGGTPTWGEVFVDDKKQDLGTPCNLDLTEGPHKIAVVKEGYTTVEGYKLVNIYGGDDIEVNFKLIKK
jgi:serine/threonine protein kinase